MQRCAIGRPTILVVDDDLMVQELVADICGRYAQVLVAADGSEGLLVLKREGERIHAVVTDIVMYPMRGDEFIEAVATQHAYPIGVLAISGYWTPSRALRLLRFENSPIIVNFNYFEKPFRDEILEVWIEETLQMVQVRRSSDWKW